VEAKLWAAKTRSAALAKQESLALWLGWLEPLGITRARVCVGHEFLPRKGKTLDLGSARAGTSWTGEQRGSTPRVYWECVPNDGGTAV
jgi:hypothetical protein